MLDRRGEMVAAYVAYAQSIEENDRPRATALLRKALRLDETGPRAQPIQSALMYLEGEDLLARGIADADLFRRAVALDPGNTRAAAELARLEATTEAKQSHLTRWIAAAAVFVLAVAGILLFGGRRRPRAAQ
jgi:cytochrome c-type biogenesis protein CcmH/NrfG